MKNKFAQNSSKVPAPLADGVIVMKSLTATTPLNDYPERPKTADTRAEFSETTRILTAEKVPLELVSAAAHQYQAAEIHWNGGIHRWGLND